MFHKTMVGGLLAAVVLINAPLPLWVVVVFLTTTSVADCSTITVWGTGLDNSGQLLPLGTQDPHYSIIATPAGSPSPITPLVTANNPTDYPWAADTPTSQWINPTGNGLDNLLPGYYTYQTTFDLSGFDPNTARIALNLAVDNAVNVYLNGADTGISLPWTADSEGYLHPFNISGGFVSGLNTLVFQVYNGYGTDPYTANPTGIQVQVASATASPVPEPSTLTMLGVGAIGLVRYGFRRRKRQAA